MPMHLPIPFFRGPKSLSLQYLRWEWKGPFISNGYPATPAITVSQGAYGSRKAFPHNRILQEGNGEELIRGTAGERHY